MNAITKERWLQAQAEEVKHHNYFGVEGFNRWKNTYENNFRYLNIDKDCGGKKIMEIGCGFWPALIYCENYSAIIVEPLLKIEGHNSLHLLKEGGRVFARPVEEIDLPKTDEIWLFNVMQHIIDPELFVSKCKASASIIRFFEPIDYPVSDIHPHTYSLNDFKNWFGDCVQFYNETNIPNFHDGPCAYGVWEKGEYETAPR